MGKYVPKPKINPCRVGMATKRVVIDIDVDVMPISDADKEEIKQLVLNDIDLNSYVTDEELHTTIGELPPSADNVVDYIDQKTAEVESTVNEFSVDLNNRIDIVNERIDEAETAIEEVDEYAHSIVIDPISEEEKQEIVQRAADYIIPQIKQDDDDIEYNPSAETLNFSIRE